MDTITDQNIKINLLEKKCETYEENISTLRCVVSRQQRTIANIDQESRDNNFIISGLKETLS